MLVAGLSDAQMHHQPIPGEWGVRDVISHLLFTERLLAERVRLLLTEDDPDLAGAAVWNYETDPRTASDLLDRKNFGNSNVYETRGSCTSRRAAPSGSS